ncbi:helix-turn-helix transcriptional regulator [Vagococcus fluvialis]|uniref:helix-turn-helix domain-containing protein n=1 Tax=Vagococcus fluvialis TaxID=2738 RepID=UPI001A8DDA84|nr:helix-turn-helix domain-containing protein [Vagococcus fluvialis]MBO0419595.1 helix-turn-helix transcriptional regulator [Vagococcus fluvialis]
MNIAETIKVNRKQKKLTQDELAEKIHVSRQTISSWENSKSLPDVTSLVLLSDVYQISLDELIKGDISMIKKLEVKESKEKLNSKFIINNMINLLLLILGQLLRNFGYNSFVSFFITVIILVNSVPVITEVFKYKKISEKNKII